MRPASGIASPGLAWRGKRFLAPSLADLFLVALLLATLGRPQSWLGLLADGDTGWHIRTGEYILNTAAVPRHDLFSFTRPGEPWFAWEWLADVFYGWLHHWHGLGAVAAFSAVLLCLSATCLFCWLLRRGAGLWIALAVTLAAVSASTVHYLARPHVFSLLFVTVTLWVLDEDRRHPSGVVWSLVPLSALWANLHGGFVSGVAIVGLLAVVCALQGKWSAVRRYGALTGCCGAATFLNPYGWHLHQHIAGYLSSTWILDNVQEFQSPRIRSEGMLVFAALLLGGALLASRSLERKEWFEGVLVVVWGFAALRSARHVPLYAVAAAPVIAGELAGWWRRMAAQSSARSPSRILWELSEDLGRPRGMSLWAPAGCAVALLLTIPSAPVKSFPEPRFPVVAVERNLAALQPDVERRILTSDQWADYLIYRLYPRIHVFFDGRSDFYGPAIGGDYQVLLSAGAQWRQILSRYRFDAALLPRDWPLGTVLENDPRWRVIYRDAVAVLLVRGPDGLMKTRETAECISESE